MLICYSAFFRPGELDPDPESKPAKPDAIDLDEYQKEMLSEVRARVANTRGKKAKRKARERQLEESHRLALLQKRRELKAAGINVKVTTVKKGQMDYNADIPFEKAPAPGFYDTTEEIDRNEKQRAAFDPRKAQANKRKADEEEQDNRKKKKDDKSGGTFAAAMKAGHLQKIREAEQSSKRRPLNLPAPQISESEIEEIVKMGMIGERAIQMAGEDNEDTRGLVGKYTTMTQQPLRTPRVPQADDLIANEIKNIRALNDTNSSLLGGENTPLHEIGSRKTAPVTTASGMTPAQTPRDTYALNARGVDMVGATPKDIRNRESLLRKTLRSQLNALPKPKELEFELEEMPTETPEPEITREALEQDAAERDRLKKKSEEDIYLEKARETLAQEAAQLFPQETWNKHFEDSWSAIHSSEKALPGLSLYDDEDDKLEEQQMISLFDIVQASLMETAEQGGKLEKKVALHNGGYQNRAKLLRNKIIEAHETLEKTKFSVDAFRILQIGEDAGLNRRLEALREEVQFITRREREAQGEYKQLRDELEALDLSAAAR